MTVLPPQFLPPPLPFHLMFKRSWRIPPVPFHLLPKMMTHPPKRPEKRSDLLNRAHHRLRNRFIPRASLMPPGNGSANCYRLVSHQWASRPR